MFVGEGGLGQLLIPKNECFSLYRRGTLMNKFILPWESWHNGF